jgi:hypothetical protein
MRARLCLASQPQRTGHTNFFEKGSCREFNINLLRRRSRSGMRIEVVSNLVLALLRVPEVGQIA